jgi:hypothetical protein
MTCDQPQALSTCSRGWVAYSSSVKYNGYWSCVMWSNQMQWNEPMQ